MCYITVDVYQWVRHERLVLTRILKPIVCRLACQPIATVLFRTMDDPTIQVGNTYKHPGRTAARAKPPIEDHIRPEFAAFGQWQSGAMYKTMPVVDERRFFAGCVIPRQ